MTATVQTHPVIHTTRRNTNPHDTARMTATEAISEVEFLLKAGTDCAPHIAARTGYANVESLTRALQREKRHDLAAMLAHRQPLDDDGMIAAGQLGIASPVYRLSTGAERIHRNREHAA